MKKRKLGNTDLELTPLSFGASSLGAEFRSVDTDEALKSVRVALDSGMNFIDTSPFYGRGMSEVLLGIALKACHVTATISAQSWAATTLNILIFRPRGLRKVSTSACIASAPITSISFFAMTSSSSVRWIRSSKKHYRRCERFRSKARVRYIGISGYPMKIFKYVLEQAPLDCVLSYNHYCLQNTMFNDLVPYLKEKGCGIMNAAPFCARLLTNAPLPEWHRATPEVRQTVRKAADACSAKGVDIAKLALQFSIANPDMTTCVSGSANPGRIAQWAEWAEEPMDMELLAEVQEILKPAHNWHHIEGCPENNDGQ